MIPFAAKDINDRNILSLNCDFSKREINAKETLK